ncbi:hypothetical protein QF035_004787 [Streptomyces umbrinus]|uniref:Uncharacterized protein n=1 Tax=Streptomyces umbrinus TaxID=67370 RepID=A0ABU0SUH7_9ACTN|nr:hypothetical protein [Streptomyces umbrinus]MDQ1027205.1 hypothetical protein [Streptomyces umbrinus]
MTHNGQGDEPSARPAHEGIVLPSDGGEPLLPGQTGDRAVPAGGQAWDQPWGPGPASGASPEPGQGWTPTGEWGNAGQDQGAQAPGWGTQHTGQGGAAPAPGAPAQDAPPQISSWTAQAPDAGAQTPGWDGSAPGSGAGAGAGAQGGYAGQPSQYADPTAQYGAQGTAGGPWGGPQAPNSGGQLPPQNPGAGSVPQQGSGAGTPLPHEGAPMNGYGPPQTPGPYAPENAQGQAHAQGPAGAQAPGGYGYPQAPAGHAAPQPQPQGGSAGSQAPGGYGYPQAPGGQTPGPYAAGGQTAAPLPPVGAGAGALPPVAAMDEGATQYLPPVPAAPSVDEGATQLLPPVGPGALPPEMPPAGAAPTAMSSESTRYLGRVRPDGPGPVSGGSGAGPLPPAVDPDAQPTQFIAPVPAQPGAAQYGVRPGVPEDRQQPPAEFDNLFRADAGGSTQQLPRVGQPRGRHGAAAGFGTPNRPGAAGGPGVPEGPAGRGARRGAADGDNGRGGRTRSRVPVIAAVGVGIAVLGIGAGALLSGGGGDKGDDNTTVAATAPATDDSASASADPAKEQAVALDKLLADSGDSRDSVVKAVGNVRKCSNLGQAATDLRNAAKQRDGLVTSLADLSVDKLPNHAQLTAALNSAWKASSAADTHYAAWADQTAGKKGCRKGQARNTGQTAAGNRESGTATTQKAKAAKLWNSIAQTYGLTERQPGQL